MAQKTHTWQIVVLRANAKPIGEVEAPDEESAIKKAIKELDIPPNEQRRLMAIRK